MSDDDYYPEQIFQATIRNGNKWFTWSYNSQGSTSFESFTNGFEWRESTQTSNRNKKWENESDIESDSEDETCGVGSSSDRTMLGLPPTGPLKIEDVKNAYVLQYLHGFCSLCFEA